MPKQDVYICRTHLVFPAKGDHPEVQFAPDEEIPAQLFIEREIKSSALVRSGQVKVRTVERNIPVDPEIEELEREIAKLEEGPSEEEQAAQDAARLEATEEE